MSLRCLLVRVSGRELAVPIESIANIAEHEMTPPPPLAQDCVCGLAVHGETLFAVVSLESAAQRESSRTDRRKGKCLLLKSSGRAAASGFEVDAVGRIVELQPGQAEFRDWSTPPRWLIEARDPQGGVVPILAVAEVQRTLEQGGSRAALAA